MRRAVLTLLLLLPLAVGCGEQSRIAPEATVTVRGTALTPAGAPLTDRPVRLGSGVADDDALLAVLTAGLACTSGVCRGTVFDGATDGSGAYRFSLKGSDTQGTFGGAKSELVTVSAAPVGQQVTGAAASARFVVQTTDVRLPVLRLVDPRLSVDGRAPVLRARWTTTAPGPYALSFETDSSVPAWQQTTAASGAALDGRVLEGTAGRVTLSGGSTDATVGSQVALRWRSPGAAYVAGASVPASRGASCTANGRPLIPCGLTDGNLSNAVPVPKATCTSTPATCPPAAAVVDLAGAPRADLVVVRGCSGTCPVSTSADGVTFRTVGAVTTGWATLALDRRPVRALRVGLGDAGLREISLFTPSDAPALTQVDSNRLDRLRSPYVVKPVRGTGHRWVWVGLGVLGAGVLLGVGVLIGRSRR